jgi:hypothetical protein
MISSFKTSRDKILKGNEFELDFTFKNNSDTTLEDIYITLDSSSGFYLVDKGSTVFVSKEIGASESIDTSLVLKYDGNNNTKVYIKFIYLKDGVSKEQSEFIAINAYHEVEKEAEKDSTPVDTTKLQPKIIIAGNDKIPLGKAGEKLTVKFKLENIGSYTAKNVEITPHINEIEGSPVLIDKINPVYRIDSIKKGESKDVEMSLLISKSASSGTYAINTSLEYFNNYGDKFTEDKKIYLQIENTISQSKIVIYKVETNPSVVKVGESAKLEILLKNMGSELAKDIKATLNGLDSNGFSLNNSMASTYISEIKGSSYYTLVYSIHTSPNMIAGNHSLSLKLDYTDGTKKQITDEEQFFIALENDKKSNELPQLRIENLKNPEYSVIPDKDFNVEFELKNDGEADVKNVKIKVSSDDALIMKSLDTRIYNNIRVGSTEKLIYTFSASEEAQTRNYPISINIEYEQGTGENLKKHTLEQYVGVMVENQPSKTSEKTIPRIIVNNYSYDPQVIIPANNFNLKFSLQNTSKIYNVKNIKVVVSPENNVFVPLRSSSTIFIDHIAKGSSVEKNLNFNVPPTTEAKIHSVFIDIEYEDENGNPFTTRENISIPLSVKSNITIGEINLPSETYINQATPISVDFFNTGKVTLNNLLVKIEGDFEVDKSSYFVGNFDTGKTDYFDATITPLNKGECKGTIIFSYQEISGETSEIRKDFKTNVIDILSIDEILGTKNDEIEKKVDFTPVLYVFLIILLILSVIGIVLFRMKKRKEAMLLDE